MFVSCTSCGKAVESHARFCPACGQEHPARKKGESDPSPTEKWQASFDAGIDATADGDFQTALARLGEAIVDAPDSQVAKCLATRGYVYLCLEQYERALCDCEEAIHLDPADWEAVAWRGSALAGLSRWREAIEDLKAAIELRPDDALQYEQVALSHTESAILDFRQRVRSGDASFQLFYDRGVIYAFRGELEKAIRDFTQSIEANESHGPSYFARAECLSEAGRDKEALEDCTRAIELGHDESDVYRLRSALAEDCGDLDLALADLNHLLSRPASDPQLLRRRAQIHARQQRFELAHRDFTLLIQLNGGQADAFVARGIARSELGDHWGAIDDFTRSLEQVSDDAETLAHRGEAKLALGETKPALEDFDTAIELNSVCTAARRGRALVYSASGRHQQALELLGKVLRLDPQYGLGLAAKGRIYQELRQFDQAIEAYDQAINRIGDGRGAADTHYRRGVCLAAGERWKEALADLDEAIRRRQTHAGSYVWRANVRFRTGQWLAALDDLTAASRLNPSDAPHYRELAKSACQIVIDRLSKSIAAAPTADNLRDRGVARHFIGQTDEALDDFKAAIDRDPASVVARSHRAKILRQRGDANSALTDFDAVVEAEPREARHRLERAQCLLDLGELQRALTDLSSAIESAPHMAEAFLARGELRLRLRQQTSAMADLDQAISLAPQRAEAYFQRGKIRAANKQYSRAIEDLNRAIQRAPRLEEAVSLRAELLSRAGENERALTDFETAVQLSPRFVPAHCGRALTLARLGKHDVAMRELTKVLRLFGGQELAKLVSCRAKIAYNAGQFRRAVSDFDAAIEIGSAAPEQAQSMYGRGLALFQLEDAPGAKESLRQAVTLNPDFEAALDVLDWLDGVTTEKPGQLDPPRAGVKLSAPPLVRARINQPEAGETWDTDPPWNLWLVSSSDSDTEYGPVDRSILDRWCQQGRISERTLLLRTDWDEWRWAGEVYPQLGGSDRDIPQKAAEEASGDEPAEERLSFPEIQV